MDGTADCLRFGVDLAPRSTGRRCGKGSKSGGGGIGGGPGSWPGRGLRLTVGASMTLGPP